MQWRRREKLFQVEKVFIDLSLMFKEKSLFGFQQAKWTKTLIEMCEILEKLTQKKITHDSPDARGTEKLTNERLEEEIFVMKLLHNSQVKFSLGFKTDY